VDEAERGKGPFSIIGTVGDKRNTNYHETRIDQQAATFDDLEKQTPI